MNFKSLTQVAKAPFVAMHRSYNERKETALLEQIELSPMDLTLRMTLSDVYESLDNTPKQIETLQGVLPIVIDVYGYASEEHKAMAAHAEAVINSNRTVQPVINFNGYKA